MAEFNYYCTWDESLDYLHELVNLQRFTFVVDMWYSSIDEILQFTSLSDPIMNILQKHSRLYLWSEEYSRFPPILIGPHTSNLSLIYNSNCGPALDILFPHGYKEENEIARLGCGFLMYQPYYVYPGTYNSYAPPEKLKQAYKDVRTLLQKKMVKGFSTRTASRPFWIGKTAINLLENGQAVIRIGGNPNNILTGRDLIPARLNR